MKKIFLLILFLALPVWADMVLYGKPSIKPYRLSFEDALYVSMFLTAIIETFLLWCFKFRGWKVLTYFFILNLISNLIVNLALAQIHTLHVVPETVSVSVLEFGVVVLEAGLLGLMTGYHKKVWLTVFGTNLASFLIGLFFFRRLFYIIELIINSLRNGA